MLNALHSRIYVSGIKFEERTRIFTTFLDRAEFRSEHDLYSGPISRMRLYLIGIDIVHIFFFVASSLSALSRKTFKIIARAFSRDDALFSSLTIKNSVLLVLHVTASEDRRRFFRDYGVYFEFEASYYLHGKQLLWLDGVSRLSFGFLRVDKTFNEELSKILIFEKKEKEKSNIFYSFSSNYILMCCFFN